MEKLPSPHFVQCTFFLLYFPFKCFSISVMRLSVDGHQKHLIGKGAAGSLSCSFESSMLQSEEGKKNIM